MKVALASQQEINEAIKVAKAWVKNHPMFEGTGSALAAAEFGLNIKGKTMYEHCITDR